MYQTMTTPSLLSALADAGIHCRRSASGCFVPLHEAPARKKDVFSPPRPATRTRLFLEGLAVRVGDRRWAFAKEREVVAFVSTFVAQPVFTVVAVAGGWRSVGGGVALSGRVPGATAEAALVHGVLGVLDHGAGRHYAFAVQTG